MQEILEDIQRTAFSSARLADEVKSALLRQSRQRWTMERWCSAGRFQRMVDVAERWDGQVLCKQLAAGWRLECLSGT